ncbi:uncharacterized protein LOC131331973 [Rhododendron vialii]|uniref:uncharacterized protein LOC131331973 n=1 Tax=Rhododendron vialii TaxID=182163 RepID=UPI00265FFC0D|nr:uncharacterized protein LOC131331973 [Rhododendron vialii]
MALGCLQEFQVANRIGNGEKGGVGSSKGGYGIIVRGDTGCFVAAAMGVSLGCSSPAVAESMALRRGMQLGLHLGLTSVVMESDSQSIISILNDQIEVSQDVCVVLNDVRALEKNFHNCIFSFSKLSANNVAHVLACKGLVGEGYSFWTESLREFLIPY